MSGKSDSGVDARGTRHGAEVTSVFSLLGYTVSIDVKRKGRSGVFYQMQLIAERDDQAISVYLNLKDHRLGLGEVMRLWAETYDAGIRGLIISTSEPSKDAAMFARFYGMSVVVCSERHIYSRLLSELTQTVGERLAVRVPGDAL